MESGMSTFGLVAVVSYVAGTILWIWMIVDCVTKESSKGIDKYFWILLIVMGHVIGALIYLFVRRQKRIEQFGK